MALPPELRNRIYELVLADDYDITQIYPEHMQDAADDQCLGLWQPEITRVSRELRQETLGIFYRRWTFHFPLTSTSHCDGMGYDIDDDGSGCYSEDDFLNDTISRFCDFRQHVECWFRTNAEHLKFMKTLTMGICVQHTTSIKVVVSGGAVQSTVTVEPASASVGTCWALRVTGKRQLAARLESVLGTGTARQPYLTLDVCLGLLDVMEKYGRIWNCGRG
ncbi:hypothetical protein LTR74_007982 [Friedmanniomyces endolithicus]|nr:hypothetical protein LTR74_007982 [Friedmanniomyces endolithicus]